jgi:SAM-dependent methyltransferase
MMNYIESSICEKHRQNELAEKKKKVHASYAMKHLFHRQAERMFENLGNMDSVLDVGCGLGDLTVLGAKRTEGKILGIDISDRCVEIVQRRLRNIRPNTGAILVDIQDSEPRLEGVGTFNRVFMKGVVHHLEHPDCAFRVVFDLLNPGGTLIIVEGNVSSRYRGLLLVLANALGLQHEASQYPHKPPAKIGALLEQVGFNNVKISYIPGAFAPFAYMGIGGPFFWKIADCIETVCDHIAKRFFGWWALILASKD